LARTPGSSRKACKPRKTRSSVRRPDVVRAAATPVTRSPIIEIHPPPASPAAFEELSMRAMPLVSAVVSLLAIAASAAAGPAAPRPLASSVQNIRARDNVATLFLRFGHEKSARFREIVRALEGSNVIVYVDVRLDAEHPVGGGLTFIGEAHGIRWVRATVDSGTANYARTCQDIVRLTSILGHELQHALEASQAASMLDAREFERHFRAIGVDEGPRVLDTIAARETGARVADELRGMARPAGNVVLAGTEPVPVGATDRTTAGS
jgi:hypothetical protein